MMIRDAIESDLAEIGELLLVVQQLHVEAQPETYRPITHAQAVELVAQRWADATQRLRVAETESAMQGYYSAAVRAVPDLPLLQPGQFIYVQEIVVAPGSRRRGVGRALLADLNQFAREQGVAQIKLDVAAFNTAARTFFLAEGFLVAREG